MPADDPEVAEEDPFASRAPAAGRGLVDAIETGPRVFIRHPVPADEEEFLTMVLASRGLHGQWIRPPANPQDFSGYLTRARKRTGAAFLVCRIPDGAILGVFNLAEISPRLRTAYCSYFVHAAFARQGLMSEAMQLLMHHAFTCLGLHVLGAAIQPGNAASLRLVQRSGFRLEKAPPRYLRLAGVWRGHPTWSITAERWRMLSGSSGG